MDENKWDGLVERLTAGNHTEFVGNISDCNHAHLAYNLFLKHDLDKAEIELLDLGCGPNATLQEMVSCQWYGFDIDPPKREVENYFEGDAHELPFADKSFDVVFCSHILEHTVSPIIVLDEIKRVLRDDGKVVIGVPHYPGFLGDDHNYILTPGGWKHLFHRSGFKVLDAEEARNCLNVLLSKRVL